MSQVAEPPRIVLDTNVCLDLFLFQDPGCAALHEALCKGAVQAVTRVDCRDEWCRVLHYPQLPVTAGMRPGLVAAYDACLTGDWADEANGHAPQPLPRCADPDDQKFLELAQLSGARWLVSKDKALLTLDRRTRQDGLFAIVLPQHWTPPA